MTIQATTQPSEVSTQETPRPTDNSVVTSEIESGATDESNSAAEPEEGAQTPDASAPSESDNQDPKKRRDRKSERRIKQLTKKLAAAESATNAERVEREKLEEELEGLRARVPKPEKPKLADFEDEDKFAEAYTSWKEASKPKPKAKTRPPKPSNEGSIATAEEIEAFRLRGVEAVGDAFSKAHANVDLPVNKVMGEYILESDLGPQMLVYLSNNPDEAKEIHDESTVEIVLRMRSIEAELAKKKSKVDGAEKKPAKRTGKATKAPPPGPEAESGVVVSDVDLTKVDMDTYAARRMATIRSKYR